MVEVRFNSHKEFLEELERDKELVDGGIVRLTCRQTPFERIPSHHFYQVVATALVGQKLVKLETFCGDDWNHEHKPPERARQVMRELEEGLKALGLEVRPGVLAATEA